MRRRFKFPQRKQIRKRQLATRQDRIMTLANTISISRIFLAFPLVWILSNFDIKSQEMAIWVFGLILLIVITDLLDGWVARRADQITNFGKVIDPVADKICLMVVLTFLIFEFKSPFIIYFILISIRDLYLIVIGVYLINQQEEVFQSNLTGKWFLGISALMMISFIFLAPEWIRWSLYSITMVLMGVSTWQYANRYHRYFKLIDK